MIKVDGRPTDKRAASEDQVEIGAEASQDVPEDCLELLKKRESELKDAQERTLRLAAELDNTRKRLEREKSDGISYANESIMRQLVEVIDNLERAIEHGEKENENCAGLLEGVRMTLKAFVDVLARFGAAPFESVGECFDPNKHEAVLQEQNPDYPDMTVTREFQKGYTLRDRLLRPARVAVARSPKESTC
ncbi:MAG: nucleotide exchange factor GrpE [Syntrophobacteraceae bacterium]|nr:nucleotide exchange factor GrpE [Syntrophobacteraceae bacterium]